MLKPLFGSLCLLFLFVSCEGPERKKVPVASAQEIYKTIYNAPDTSSLGNDLYSETVRYGARLMAHTAYFIGPEGTVSKNLGNKMNCTNCHLASGTKPYGLNFFDSHRTYPQYRAREDAILTMSDRVNNCITRPHNGIALKLDGKEMNALVTYIKWVGEGYSPEKHVGYGLKPIHYDILRADSKRGEAVYMTHCKTCHQADGQGLMLGDNSTYQYPPLWGNKSYQEGSSMHRVIKAARFIKYNMPNLLTTHEKPTLTDQEALDVAAFINDSKIHTRPKSPFKCYLNLKNKPIDYFQGPYADPFSEDQHTFGPWYEIEKFYVDNGLKVNK
jgi:thiosulfate dehydrogenase